VQLATAPEMRGRAMSLFALIFEGTTPVGGLVTGLVAAWFGGPAALIAAGVVAIGLISVGSRHLRRLRLDGGRAARPASQPGAPVSPA
jgi:hypothetical protein